MSKTKNIVLTLLFAVVMMLPTGLIVIALYIGPVLIIGCIFGLINYLKAFQEVYAGSAYSETQVLYKIQFAATFAFMAVFIIMGLFCALELPYQAGASCMRNPILSWISQLKAFQLFDKAYMFLFNSVFSLYRLEIEKISLLLSPPY